MTSVYARLAKKMSDIQLGYALNDVSLTLSIWDRSPEANQSYLNKLYAEFDAYTVEYYRRVNKSRKVA